MTDELKIIELTQKIKALEAKVQHLQKILDDAGMEYNIYEQVPKDNDIDSIAQLNQQSEQQGLSILPETITSRHASYFFRFSRVGRMCIASVVESQIKKQENMDIIRSAGIFGRMEFALRKLECK